jgi:hypothetical protein
LKGVIVETNPVFWFLLVVAILLAYKFRKTDALCSFSLVFVVGLSLRLLPAVHSLYPGFDPWNELSSIHHIQTYGFDLLGHYYHSALPVLQLLLLSFIPVFGEYNTIAYFGPVLGWLLAYVCLYKLGREFFDKEKTLFLLIIYSCANVASQFFTTPETLALGIGFATVFFFHRNLSKPSIKYSIATTTLFTLLVFTHHLTALSVVLATGAIIILVKLTGAKIKNTFLVWFGMLSIFLTYYELYQGLLSTMIVLRTTQLSIGLPTGWAKPLWWWTLYLLPLTLLVLASAIWILPPLKRRKIVKPIEVFAMIVAGGFSVILGLVYPTGLPPLRVFNQFGAHFFNGALNTKFTKIIAILLSSAFLVGITTQFPVTNSSDLYLGGYWISHSSEEIQSLEYFVKNANQNSLIAADGRIRPVLNSLSYASRNVSTSTRPEIMEVYETNSTKHAWDYCRSNGILYVFVSSFYKTIAQFDVYSGAARFSDEQLSKFSSPYFALWYNNSEVSIYLVITDPTINP